MSRITNANQQTKKWSVFLDTENLRLCPFHLNNEIRENRSFIKILEVIVDRNLTFEQHAEAVIARGKNTRENTLSLLEETRPTQTNTPHTLLMPYTVENTTVYSKTLTKFQ